MGVSTTHRINLSIGILIYSFSDTYYVWAACELVGRCNNPGAAAEKALFSACLRDTPHSLHSCPRTNLALNDNFSGPCEIQSQFFKVHFIVLYLLTFSTLHQSSTVALGGGAEVVEI